MPNTLDLHSDHPLPSLLSETVSSRKAAFRRELHRAGQWLRGAAEGPPGVDGMSGGISKAAAWVLRQKSPSLNAAVCFTRHLPTHM